MNDKSITGVVAENTTTKEDKNFILSLLIVGVAGIMMIFFLLEIFFYMCKDNIDNRIEDDSDHPHFEIAKE